MQKSGKMFWVLKLLLLAAIFAGLAILVARLVFPLPSLDRRISSSAIPASPETPLGAAILPLAAAHPGVSGVVPLVHGPDAFAARVLMADIARQSIDARYYIWQKDASGLLLLDALRRAAGRGVRVRLLVDDNGIDGLDAELSALDALPNFEVRLFNPFTFRSPKFASYLFDFVRLNRRMHNKSFTVDGSVTVVGGRNIGDIYFARGEEAHYFDLDVIAVGQAAADVNADFDLYWSSQSSYPMALLVDPAPDGLNRLAAGVADAVNQPDAREYAGSIRDSDYVRALVAGTLPLEWVPMTLVSDDPAKGLGQAGRDGLMISRLAAILGETRVSLVLISAYFVPGTGLRAYLGELAGKGVRVRALTNSMEATDVLPVHAGYAWYRGGLIDSGVEMYELKSGRDDDAHKDDFGFLGSATTSLHAKTFSIDGKRVFVGSFNFDPRSAQLNCEMGFLIDSAAIAHQIAEQFDQRVAEQAYRVRRRDDGALEWIETGADGAQIRYDVEPRTSVLARIFVRAIGWLPITWML
jgi:putative cardiolipin synthase